jgi:hypothetical protein
MDAEKVWVSLAAAKARLAAFGHETEMCLTDLGSTGEAVVAKLETTAHPEGLPICAVESRFSGQSSTVIRVSTATGLAMEFNRGDPLPDVKRVWLRARSALTSRAVGVTHDRS